MTSDIDKKVDSAEQNVEQKADSIEKKVVDSDMEIAECIFCHQVFKATKEDLVQMRKSAQKLGRKKWKSIDFLDVIVGLAGDCDKKEGDDKKHVLKWNGPYLNGNIGISKQIVDRKKQIDKNEIELGRERLEIDDLNKKIEDIKAKIEDIKTKIDELDKDTHKEMIELPVYIRQLLDRTGGSEVEMWIEEK